MPFVTIVAMSPGALSASATILVIALLSLYKCISVMRRKESSTLCLLALTCWMSMLLLSSLNSFTKQLLPPSLEPLTMILFGGLAILLMLAALILAIIGLATYSSPRDIPYKQGKAQAIWAIVLITVPFAIAVIFGVVSAAKAIPAQAVDTEPITNLEFNYRFKPPGRPWIKMDAKVHNAEAALMYRSIRPNSIYVLIAEKLGTYDELTTESLIDVVKTNLQVNPGTFEFKMMPDRSLNGIDYTVIRTKATNYGGTKGISRIEHWITLQNGYCFQHMVYTKRNEEERVGKEIEEITSGFAFADPDKVVQLTGVEVAPFRDESIGVSVDLSKTGWSEYENKETDYSESAFAASKGVRSTGITYLNLGNFDPEIDDILSGMLASDFEVAHPAETTDRSEIEQGIASGIEVTTKREIDEVWQYLRFRLLRHNEHAWLIASWSVNDTPEELKNDLDQYDFFEPKAQPEQTPVSDLSDNGRAGLINQIGLAYYRRQNHTGALPYFQEAYRIEPENSQFFENITDALYRSTRYEELIENVNSKPEFAVEHPVLHSYKAASFSAMNQPSDAAEAYEAAFAEGYNDEDDLLAYINVIVELEEQDRALTTIEEFEPQDAVAGISVTRWKASLLSQLERHEESIELLESLHSRNPYNLRVAYDLINRRLDSEHYGEALVEVEELLKKGTNDAELLLLKGRSKLGLKSYREAKTAFEEAARLAPGDQDVEDYLDYTATMLGKGNIASINRPIEPVPLPSEIASLKQQLRDKHAKDLSQEYGIVTLERSNGIFFEPGKPEKRTQRRVVKITAPGGLDDYSTLRFHFDPSYESIYINEVVVRDEEGKVLGKGKTEDYFIVDRNDNSLATTEKVVHVPVPGIAVGATLSYTVTTENQGQSKKLGYESLPLCSSYPATGAILYFLCNKEELATRTAEEIQTLDVADGIAYYTENPPIRQFETMSQWSEQIAPWISYSSPHQTWKEEVKDYLKRLDPVLKKGTEEAKKLAESLTKEAANDEEKIALISTHVSELLTYQGIEFGPRGQIPSPFSEVTGNRYGDCKDHSLVLVKLLRSIGIKASLALVSTSSPIKEELPSLDQFNHMIAYVPGAASSPFIDLTYDYFPFGDIPPDGLLFEDALIMDSDQVRLEKVLPNANSINGFDSERSVRIDPEDSSSIIVDETLRLSGYPATWFRGYFHDWRAPEYKKQIGSLLRNYGNPSILSVEVAELNKVHVPLILKMSYRLERFLSKQGEFHAISAPCVWERYFYERRDSGERKNPFEILVQSEFRSKCLIHLPDSAAIQKSSLEALALQNSDSFVEWEISASETNPGELVIVSKGIKKVGTHPKEQFSTFVKSTNSGIKEWQTPILFSQKAEQ